MIRTVLATAHDRTLSQQTFVWEHAQYQDPETEVAKWSSASIHFIILWGKKRPNRLRQIIYKSILTVCTYILQYIPYFELKIP